MPEPETKAPASAPSQPTAPPRHSAKSADGPATIAHPETPTAPATPTGSDPLLARVLENLENRTRPIGPALAKPGMDESVPGGVFIVNGSRVNCYGREVDEEGNVLRPEELRLDPTTGRLI